MASSQHRESMRRPSILVVIVLLMGWAMSGPVAAQGTSGTLPDPISGEQITDYAARLGLSEQQRLAVDRFHVEYLQSFRELRDGPIQSFLDEQDGTLQRLIYSPDAGKVRRTINDLDRLMRRIRSLDNQLFDQMQTLLSEEQTAMMPRVRQMRERERLASGFSRMIAYRQRTARVDVSAIVQALDLPRDAQARIDPELAVYEQRLTAMWRRLGEQVQGMVVDVSRTLERELGATDANDRQARRRAFATFREAWTEASNEPIATLIDIAELNRSVYTRLRQPMSHETLMAFRDQMMRRAYPDLVEATRSIPRYDRALAMDGIDDSLRSEIRAARDQQVAQHLRLDEQAMDAQDVIRGERSMTRGRTEEWRKARARLESIQEQRRELNEQAIATLEAMLGEGLTTRLAQSTAGDDATSGDPSGIHGSVSLSRADGTRTTVSVAGPSGASDNANKRTAAPGDPYLPEPISRDELDRYQRLLDLDADGRAVLDSLHQDYLGAFSRVRDEHLPAIREMQSSMWSMNPETGKLDPPSEEQIGRLFDRRRAAFKAMRAIDAKLFADAELIVLDKGDAARRAALERVRMARERIVHNRGENAGNLAIAPRTGQTRVVQRGWETEEGSIDLTALIAPLVLTGVDRARLDPLLIEYEQAVTEAFRERYTASVEFAKTMRQVGAAFARARGEQDRGSEVRERYRALQRGLGERIEQLEEAIVQQNRATLDQLAGLVDEGAASTIREAYHRQAFPDVYDDPAGAESSLRAGLALEDLGLEQRERISELLTTYLPAYEELCSQMARLRAEAAMQERRSREERQERYRQMQRLEFQRDELSSRTMRQLRAALTDGQRQRLGLVERE